MCDVQELRGRDCKECEGKGDTGRLGRRKETQETAGRRKRPQGDTRDRRETQETTGRHKRPQGGRREMQGDAGNQIARLSEE